MQNTRKFWELRFGGVKGGMASKWHFRLREGAFTGQCRAVGGGTWVQWLVAPVQMCCRCRQSYTLFNLR